MKKIKGKITALSVKTQDGKYGKYEKIAIKLNDEDGWFSGIKKKGWDACKKGDEVILDVEEKRKGSNIYCNIVGIKNLTPNSNQNISSNLPPTPKMRPENGIDIRDLRISRLSLISSLCTLYSGMPNITVERILNEARYLEINFIYPGKDKQEEIEGLL